MWHSGWKGETLLVPLSQPRSRLATRGSRAPATRTSCNFAKSCAGSETQRGSRRQRRAHEGYCARAVVSHDAAIVSARRAGNGAGAEVGSWLPRAGEDEASIRKTGNDGAVRERERPEPGGLEGCIDPHHEPVARRTDPASTNILDTVV